MLGTARKQIKSTSSEKINFRSHNHNLKYSENKTVAKHVYRFAIVQPYCPSNKEGKTNDSCTFTGQTDGFTTVFKT